MNVSLVSNCGTGLGAAHGLRKLEEALAARSAVIERADSLQKAGKRVLVVGLASGRGEAARLARQANLTVPRAGESLRVHRIRQGGQDIVLVCGRDDRGLMYALLDLADRVSWDPGKDLFANVRDTVEQPYVVERAVSKYTMHSACFDSYFHDEDYWARYLDMLASDRFNTFALLFAYESNGFMAPAYPYFFNVKGYDDIRVVGLDAAQQRRNLTSLNRVIAMTHERGLNFTLGIWDHIYRGGVQGTTSAGGGVHGLVQGVTGDNLSRYTIAALTKLLKQVPDIDAVQFRMHGESGLKRDEFDTFWGAVYGVMKKYGPGIRFDARAKEFPHELIDEAIRRGIDIRMCTKYWAEQMGLPFHPTHINRPNQHDRRHGYADMLRYPRTYKMHWRMWNGGSQRILLWGDPQYVRRFAESTHLYDGEGFEVNEPMATKMQNIPHETPPFELLSQSARYYDWEFERYWHFFQVFGRVGYDPNVPPEIWGKRFQQRFGKAAATHVERGLHRASQITPYLTAAHMYHFPTTRGWPERQRGGDMATYANIKPSDIQQFSDTAQAAQNRIDGTDSPKLQPAATSQWFARASADVLAHVAKARKAIGSKTSREFVSTMADLKILAYLALYHSRRINAAVSWNLFKLSRDANALDDTIDHEARAVNAWGKLVAAAGNIYTDNLAMGGPEFDMAGHWKDALKKLQAGLRKLQAQRKRIRTTGGRSPAIDHVPVRRTEPGKPVVVRATVRAAGKLSSVRVGYGNGDGRFKYAKMKPTTAPCYRATIPAAAAVAGLVYFIEAVDADGKRKTFPPARTKAATPVIPITVAADSAPPTVAHEPVTSAPVGKPLKITATVRDKSGVRWVRLRYRNVTQFEDYKTLEMLPSGKKKGEFQATVPADDLTDRWDFMYLIEAMDNAGNGRIWPNLETETPYIIVPLRRGRGKRKGK